MKKGWIIVMILFTLLFLTSSYILVVDNKRRRLVSIAKQDLIDYGGIDEADPRMIPYLTAAWNSVDRAYNLTDPWSAAAISYAMQRSGAKDFPRSASHSVYIVEARKQRELGRKAGAGKIELYRLNEWKPRVGDLLVSWRNREVNYDTVQVGDATHVDIIIEVKKETIIVYGGNVSNQLKSREFRLDANGYVLPERQTFALIKNEYLI